MEHVSIPSLSDSDAATARALLAVDASFQRLVGARSYDIEKIGPWTTSNGPWKAKETRLDLVGAAMLVTLEESIRIDGEKLPLVLYDVTEKDPKKPFQEACFEVRADMVRHLHVLVDLRQRKVVNISPGIGSSVKSVTPPPGFKRTVPRLSNDAPPRHRGT